MAPGRFPPVNPHSARLVAFLSSSLLALAAPWPGWRGVHRDGHTPEPLPEILPANPIPAWKIPVGHGYASPVVSDGIVLYLDDSTGSETAHAVQAANGRELWRTAWTAAWSDEFEPGPRCTPLIDGDRVYVQSAQGAFACLALADGAVRWSLSFQELGMVWVPERHSNVGASVRRGHTGSPIVDGDRIFIQVSSTRGASIIAAEKRTGKILWKSLDDQTSYSSPVVGTVAGRRQFITATCEGLVGLDSADGSLLWRHPFKTAANRNVLTPILAGDDVFFSSHSTGLRDVNIRKSDSGFQAAEKWFNRQININLPTPVLVGSHLFGVGPGREFICVDTSNGAVRWREKGFGEVANIITDGHRLLVLLDTGELRLLKPDPSSHAELGRFQACGKTYSAPAWSDGMLLVKDPTSLTAFRFAASR